MKKEYEEDQDNENKQEDKNKQEKGKGKTIKKRLRINAGRRKKKEKKRDRIVLGVRIRKIQKWKILESKFSDYRPRRGLNILFGIGVVKVIEYD